MEKTLNNWKLARINDRLMAEVIIKAQIQIGEAQHILKNPDYDWAGKNKEAAEAKFNLMCKNNEFFEELHAAAKELIMQHEGLTENMCKWYHQWIDYISDDGKQGTELLQEQADMLNEIFYDIFRYLDSLKIDIKAPKALNM
jgi:hypothetical protein